MKNILIAETIKRLRESRNLNQDDLGDLLGVSGKTVSSWEIGRTEPNMGYVQQIADLFKISTDELIYGELTKMNEMIIQFQQVPVYAPISCGTGLFVDDEIIDYVPIPTEKLTKGKEYFGQFAKGDSMVGAGILDGDIVIFEKSNAIENGRIGCFCIDEGIATCKRFNKTDSSIILMPANESHLPIVVDIMSECFRVIGVLAFVVSDRRY